MKTLGVMAIGQYNTFHGLSAKHPRKDLMERMGRSSARKVYVDNKNGSSAHIGYIVGGEWFRLYIVTQWEGK